MKCPATSALTALALLAVACSEPIPQVEVLAAPSRDGWESDAAFPGYTLIRPLRSKRTYLVDMSGTAVHSWATSKTPGGAMYLTERGTLLRGLTVEDHQIFRGGGQLGGIEELDADGSRLWELKWDSEKGLSHHDFEELPSGNVLVIAWDRHTREEALAAGRDPELLAGEEFWPDAVYEIRPTRPVGGEVVWSWHAWDHLLGDRDPRAHPERIDINGDRNVDPPSEAEEENELARMAALGYVDAGAGDDEEEDENEDQDPEEAALKARIKDADWLHTNAIDYHAAHDLIVLSTPHFSELWVLDHSTTTEEAAGSHGGRWGHGGDLLWRWGHPRMYARGTAADRTLFYQHDPQWLDGSNAGARAPGAAAAPGLRLTVYNNGGGRYEMGGDLLYRWGNPFAYGLGTWEDRQLLGQHNVQWIPTGQLGAGSLITFDNGTEKERAWSVIKEWWAPRDAEGNYVRAQGRPFGPSEPDWVYAAAEPTDFFSSFISGVQRLPNGNTLVCSGSQGWVFEVSPNGAVVWDWKNPYGLDPEVDEPPDEPDPESSQRALFRAERYAPDHPGIVYLRERGAAIPLDPGAGPATNQYVEPEEDKDAESGE